MFLFVLLLSHLMFSLSPLLFSIVFISFFYCPLLFFLNCLFPHVTRNRFRLYCFYSSFVLCFLVVFCHMYGLSSILGRQNTRPHHNGRWSTVLIIVLLIIMNATRHWHTHVRLTWPNMHVHTPRNTGNVVIGQA